MAEWQEQAPTKPGWYACAWPVEDHVEILEVTDTGYEKGTEDWAAHVSEWNALWWSEPLCIPQFPVIEVRQ